MNLIKTTLALIIALTATHVFGNDLPESVAVNFKRVYVPNDFDDNDNVQIVGEGAYASGCYKFESSSVHVDHENNIISIGSTAYKYGNFCIQIILPFNDVISIGVLKKGTYTIQTTDGKLLGHIGVRVAKSSQPDDYLYAPISQAFHKSLNSVQRVYLTGNFPLSCMKLQEVKQYIQSNVIVLLPIARIDNAVPCIDGQYPFESSVDIDPSTIKSGRYLLHVRSMNGKSINSLIDINKESSK